MSLLDIIGPVMIGPSSSHTAGAVRIGLLTRKLWNRPITRARIFLRGSFAATYWGHGTDKGLVAGLLGMRPDDRRIPNAFDWAKKSNLEVDFAIEDVDGAHPNSARLVVTDGKDSMEVVGASVGGGSVELQNIDGFSLKVTGELPALIIFHHDRPGVLAALCGELYRRGVNIASLLMTRRARGGMAVAVIEMDGAFDENQLPALASSGDYTRIMLMPAVRED